VAAVVDRAAQAVVDLVGDLLDEEDQDDRCCWWPRSWWR
jgi:hypothetical protein